MRNRKWMRHGAVAAVVVAGIVWGGTARASEAVSFQVNGTYHGKFSCKFLGKDGVPFKFVTKESVLGVLHGVSSGNGIQLSANIDGVPFLGRAIFHPKKKTTKANGHLSLCGGSDGADGTFEFHPIKLKICDRAKNAECVKAKIKLKGFLHSGGRIGTCRGSWKRVENVAPSIESCF